MLGLLGKKIGMTQIFDDKGICIPVTVLEVGPCVVTAVRSKERDQYSAVQLAFGEKKEKVANQCERGYFKKLNLKPKQYLREIRTEKAGQLKIGDEVRADNFEVGDYVDLEGTSIGKGFQGVVKRHGFKGGGKSHGSMFGRVPGSIGQSSNPKRVFKGLRAPGHMGAERVTVQNLKIAKIDVENNLIAVRGAVPGVEDGLVVIFESLKRGKRNDWKIVSKPAVEEKPAKETSEEKKEETSRTSEEVKAEGKE